MPLWLPFFFSSSFHVYYYYFYFLLLIILSLSPSPSHAACNPIDQASLSTLISQPPLNWSSETDCCTWEGISCDRNDRVSRLWLPSKALRGEISPLLFNLTNLVQLNLSHNSLTGPLPNGFFTAFNRLQVIDLSDNRFVGQLPETLSTGSLLTLNLSSNHFNGTVASSIFQSAPNLIVFDISNNSFAGPLPNSTCLCSSSLDTLDFSINNFSDQIPSGLGSCSKLRVLRAGSNSLWGQLPAEIFNCQLLQVISFPVNSLTGEINNQVVNLTNLRILELDGNKLTGGIPPDIGKLSNLETLHLHINHMKGPLPPSLMDCINLVKLNLRVNWFEGQLSSLNFSRLSRLVTIDLGNNNFTGVLPVTLFSCLPLNAVRFASNQLEGEIGPEILALKSLSYFSVSQNKLTNIKGAIKLLTNFKNLSALILSANFYGEELPSDLTIAENSTIFQNVHILSFGGCLFNGVIPNWLANLNELEVLDLSFNRFSGLIPAWFGTLPKLFYLDLSSNNLTGEFPISFTRFVRLTSKGVDYQIDRSYLELPVFVNPSNTSTLQYYHQLANLPPALYLGNNSITGGIPTEIGLLKFIHVLDLSYNNFSGTIPDQISNLVNLEKLNLSGNLLTGQIPSSLRNLHFLSSFSVAHNDLRGPIPTGGQFDTFPSSSYDGNPGLCGPAIHRSCSSVSDARNSYLDRNTKKKIIVGVTLGVCFFIAIAIVTTAICLSKRRIIPRGEGENGTFETISFTSNSGISTEFCKENSMLMIFQNNNLEIKDLTIYDILKATDNFNQANIVGCGGFGLVYKATLANGTKLAVKKLSGDMGLMEREFKAEVEVLSNARHKNLVSLQGYCVHDGIRLLIYSFMENGSLDYWLHEKPDGAAQLDWPTRLRIAKGASMGLAYMHQICDPHIVHRDIKSSNILLNEKFEAHVADFGLSRLILPYRTHVTTELVGTLGYIPPEYGQAWIATLRGDMYSFGVVMLELLTGKRPVEVFKPKMSRELVSWVLQMKRMGKSEEIFDGLLRGKGFEEEMLQVLEMACLCVNQNPLKRPTITEVVDWLQNVGAKK